MSEEPTVVPEDVLHAAREAAAKVWFDEGTEFLAAEFRAGMRDDAASVETAVIAIMAERERCALVVERTDFIEQATTSTTKTAIAYWSEKFGKLIRSGSAAPVWPEVKNGGGA